MSPDPAWPWSVLGLPARPATLADVRRAYARALKQVDQATDIAGFTALRAAYDDATHRMTTAAQRAPTPPLPDAPPPAVAVPAIPVAVPVAVAQPSPPPPIDAAPADPAAQRDAAFAALLAQLQTHSIITHLGDRIIAALADPVAQDPAYDPTLRRTIAAMLRNQLQPDSDNGLYLSLSLRGAVQALDKRYQWLSDYTAYRRDFWDQPFALDAMMACAGVRSQPAARIVQRGRKIGPREQRLNKALGGGRFGFGMAGFFASILFLSPFADGTAWESPLRWVLIGGVVGIIVFSASVLGYIFFATLQHHWRERLEKFQDRRALRRKRLLQPTKSFLQRLRASPNLWVYAGFAAMALMLLWGLIANAQAS